MSSPAVTVSPETTVREAAAIMAARGFSALPVVGEDDQLVGVVSEADLLSRRFPPDIRFRSGPDDGVLRNPGRTVAEVMNTRVSAFPAGADVADLAEEMLTRRLRSVPIVAGSRVVGVVTRRDLIAIVARDAVTVARDIRHRLEIYGGPGRWQVDVRDGVATIVDSQPDAARETEDTDRHVVRLLAESVPGVTSAEVLVSPER